MIKRAIGLMSGTSLDGIDVVLAEIEGSQQSTQVKVLHTYTYEYENSLLNKIRKAIKDEYVTSKLLCSLNFEIAEAYSKCILSFCERYGIDIHSVDYIASHGQTIYHIAEDESDYQASSLQLGDGSVLANLTNIKVVSNFRTADMAYGGQGAPLVPYADYVLFNSKDKTRLLQNIGGIANVTILEKNKGLDDCIAFDNGPGNMMIDYAMQKLFNKKYDDSGMIASKGIVITELFEEVVSNKYFKKLPPKSTGRELFGNQYTDILLNKYASFDKEDIIATLTHITAYTIAKSYQDFCEREIDEVIISGGGAHNKTLIELIKYYLSNDQVFVLEDFGYSSDYKEALAFIILGNETLQHNPSNVIKATGAKKYSILGQVSYVLK